MRNIKAFLFASFMLFIFGFSIANATETTTSSGYDPVTLDSSIQFNATLQADGSVLTTWSKYSHTETFSFYKVVRSQTNTSPVYPDDGYIYYTGDVNALSYTDSEASAGTNYYRVCQVASPKRYCSATVVKIEKATDGSTTEPIKTTSSAYEPVTYDDTISFTANLESDGSVTTNWSKYSHTDPFSFYKVIRSQTNNNPVYPEDSYIYVASDVDSLSYTDSYPPIGTNYYRVCQIAAPKRFCSKNVVTIQVTGTGTAGEEKLFSDFENDHWAYSCVKKLVTGDILSGNPDGTFHPNDPVKRAEFAKMIILSLYPELAAYGKTDCFLDLNNNEWYSRFVCAAESKGVISGYSNDIFRPSQLMTRAESTSVLVKGLEIPVLTEYPLAFTDVNDTWQRQYVYTAYKKGLVQGYADETFRPNEDMSRAEAATLICNALSY